MNDIVNIPPYCGFSCSLPNAFLTILFSVVTGVVAGTVEIVNAGEVVTGVALEVEVVVTPDVSVCCSVVVWHDVIITAITTRQLITNHLPFFTLELLI
jgi:hypothetical protein